MSRRGLNTVDPVQVRVEAAVQLCTDNVQGLKRYCEERESLDPVDAVLVGAITTLWGQVAAIWSLLVPMAAHMDELVMEQEKRGQEEARLWRPGGN